MVYLPSESAEMKKRSSENNNKKKKLPTDEYKVNKIKKNRGKF